ncbi:hypothetical protein Z945_3013 [Sulfitobacter noctilucae]|uniref:hypothetical protein n=1 Tax=Sulfitobacter noctilucae TaxID=1342302 RepID=UPI0004689B64|nr:hypothetical protein [Sulfitobacter noctilucae]KIN75114.1 hypothetical protein Z945_3013 [Sulfitobacter noctilucae]
MKVGNSFFDEGADIQQGDATRFIQVKYGKESAADFFGLDDSAASLAQFTRHWQEQGLADVDLLTKLVGRIVEGRLHPLQSLRIARLMDDPSEELEPEDKEVLIAQILELDWPQAIPGGTA